MGTYRTIEGVYRHGVVELSEVPGDVCEARVLVTFLLDETPEQGVYTRATPLPSTPPPVPIQPAHVAPAPVLPVPGNGQPALHEPPALSALNEFAVQPVIVEPPGAIIDYASPRKREGKLRLPATSRLELVRRPSDTTVIERLTGQTGTIAALIFAGFVLVVVAVMAVGYAKDFVAVSALLGALWLAEAALIPVVINNTWRRTTLSARPDALTLTFTAPFGNRQYKWPTRDVADVRLVVTQPTPPALAELEIHIVGSPLVKLFTDHLARELYEVRDALLEGMGRGEAVEQNGVSAAGAPIAG